MMSDAKTQKCSFKNETQLIDLERLFMNVETSDVNFTFNPIGCKEESIPAHKILLATRSDVFYAMFYGKLKKEGCIKIVDVTASAFREFLQFFYLSEVELTVENVCNVMSLGQKYKITACLNTCVKLLKTNLTEDNVCSIYGLAILYNKQNLKQLCEKKIIANNEVIFGSTSFLKSPKLVLRHILKLNDLRCSEVDIFKACMAWVQSASGEETITKKMVKKHLGDLFYEICFGSMTIQEFTDLTQTFVHVFSVDELQECLQMIVTKKCVPKLFMAKARQPNGNNEIALKCSRILKYTSNYHFTRQGSTTFSTNKTIMLVEMVITGLRVYRAEEQRDETVKYIPTEITITKISDENGDTTDLSKETTRLRSKGDTIVTLFTPILTRPGYKYKIQLEHSPNQYLYKVPILKTEIQLEPNINIQFHNDLKTCDGNRPTAPIIALRFERIIE